MRLNLGSGDRPQPDWTNVDNAACPYPRDETVDLTGPLPWPEGSVSHAYLGHVLEHLPLSACALLLERLLPCMAPGGQVMVVGPDINRAQGMAEAGVLEVTMESLRHGGHRWPGDEHHWECTPAILAGLLDTAGWTEVTEIPFADVDPMWPVADRGPQWQCAVTAHRRREAADD